MSYIASIVLILLGGCAIVTGLWQIGQTTRLHALEDRSSIPRPVIPAMQELEHHGEFSIYRFGSRSKIKASIKVDRTTYRGEVSGDGDTVEEAVSNALLELYRGAAPR